MSDIIKPPTSVIPGLGTPSHPTIPPFTNEVFLLSTIVAGTSFCKTIESFAQEITPQVTLTTKRKPANEHDDMAIAIFYKERQIGWVPRDNNEIISRLMDSGKIIICKVEKAEWQNKWFKIKVAVFMVD